MKRALFDKTLLQLQREHEDFLNQNNEPVDDYNGMYYRYKNPVLSHKHAPLIWRYDFNKETNPRLIERIGINAAFNSGAIYLNGKFYLV
ncbi:MAG: glycosidase, partial [Cyclobacteriaceae bacterium]